MKWRQILGAGSRSANALIEIEPIASLQVTLDCRSQDVLPHGGSCALLGASLSPTAQVGGASNRAQGLRVKGHSGTALIETAMVMPVIALVLVGMVSCGLALVESMSLESAARDVARSGAVLPYDEPPEGMTWTSALEAVAAAQIPDLGVADTICIALVDGATGNPVSSQLTTAGDGGACFAEAATDDLRVQIEVSKSATIDLAFYSHPITLSARGSARYELPRPL